MKHLDGQELFDIVGRVDADLVDDALPPSMAATVGRAPMRRPHPIRAVTRFAATGLGAAVISGVVAIGVLTAIIAAGRMAEPGAGPAGTLSDSESAGAEAETVELVENNGMAKEGVFTQTAPWAYSYEIVDGEFIPGATITLQITRKYVGRETCIYYAKDGELRRQEIEKHNDGWHSNWQISYPNLDGWDSHSTDTYAWFSFYKDGVVQELRKGAYPGVHVGATYVGAWEVEQWKADHVESTTDLFIRYGDTFTSEVHIYIPSNMEFDEIWLDVSNANSNSHYPLKRSVILGMVYRADTEDLAAVSRPPDAVLSETAPLPLTVYVGPREVESGGVLGYETFTIPYAYRQLETVVHEEDGRSFAVLSDLVPDVDELPGFVLSDAYVEHETLPGEFLHLESITLYDPVSRKAVHRPLRFSNLFNHYTSDPVYSLPAQDYIVVARFSSPGSEGALADEYHWSDLSWDPMYNDYEYAFRLTIPENELNTGG